MTLSTVSLCLMRPRTGSLSKTGTSSLPTGAAGTAAGRRIRPSCHCGIRKPTASSLSSSGPSWKKRGSTQRCIRKGCWSKSRKTLVMAQRRLFPIRRIFRSTLTTLTGSRKSNTRLQNGRRRLITLLSVSMSSARYCRCPLSLRACRGHCAGSARLPLVSTGMTKRRISTHGTCLTCWISSY